MTELKTSFDLPLARAEGRMAIPAAAAMAGLLLAACGDDETEIETEMRWPIDVACMQGSPRTFIADEHQSAIL